MINLITR